MERILFLDIDGVLVNRAAMLLDMLEDKHDPFDSTCTNTLNKIVERTGAKIVVTSAWRPRLNSDEANLKWLRDVFTVRGFKYPENIIGQTIRGYKELKDGSSLSLPRGVEIKQWLDTHAVYPWYAYPERRKEFEILNEDGSFKMMRSQKHNLDFVYAILDDDSDMLLEHLPSFFLTNTKERLTPEIGDSIIFYLNRV